MLVIRPFGTTFILHGKKHMHMWLYVKVSVPYSSADNCPWETIGSNF